MGKVESHCALFLLLSCDMGFSIFSEKGNTVYWHELVSEVLQFVSYCSAEMQVDLIHPNSLAGLIFSRGMYKVHEHF